MGGLEHPAVTLIPLPLCPPTGTYRKGQLWSLPFRNPAFALWASCSIFCPSHSPLNPRVDYITSFVKPCAPLLSPEELKTAVPHFLLMSLLVFVPFRMETSSLLHSSPGLSALLPGREEVGTDVTYTNIIKSAEGRGARVLDPGSIAGDLQPEQVSLCFFCLQSK